MKKIFSLAIVLALVLSLTTSALATTPAPGGPFKTEFIVQNLEASGATCSFVFYLPTGAAAFTSSAFTIAANDKISFYTGNGAVFGSLADGEYSAVVSCDKKVAAVVNFSDSNSGASHGGIDTPGTVFYAPAIYDNYYSYYSNIYVQNASGSPVDVTVDIYAAGQATPVKTQTATAVPAYASVSFDQANLPELANNTTYSAKITATGSIAVISNFYGGSGQDQLYSYNPFASGSNVAYAPFIANNYYGYNTSLTIQNLGAITATVTVEYTGPNAVTSNYSIGPNSSKEAYSPSVLPASYSASYAAKVTSTNSQPIVILVNESQGSGLQAASYSGFTSGGTEIRIPVVMKNYYAYNTSINCMNIGAAPASYTIAYAGIAGTTTSPVLNVGQAYEVYQPNDPNLASVPANWSSSATVTSAQNIVCVANESSGAYPGDQLYAYNGTKP